MKPTPRYVFGLLFAICLSAFAQTSLAIEGIFVAPNPMKQMAELEPDPARKATMLKAAALAAQSIEVRGDSLIKRQGDLTTRYQLADHRPFLLGTVNYPDGSTGYCAIYIKDDNTLIVGDERFDRQK